MIDTTLLDATDALSYKSTYTVTLPANGNGYISDLNGSTTFIFPAVDTGSATPTNMKMATLQVDSPTETDILKLRVYSANIGTPEYFTRDF